MACQWKNAPAFFFLSSFWLMLPPPQCITRTGQSEMSLVRVRANLEEGSVALLMAITPLPMPQQQLKVQQGGDGSAGASSAS